MSKPKVAKPEILKGSQGQEDPGLEPGLLGSGPPGGLRCSPSEEGECLSDSEVKDLGDGLAFEANLKGGLVIA